MNLTKHGTYRGNRAIILLRIFLWLIPSIILCMALCLAEWLGELWYLSLILMLAAFTAIGTSTCCSSTSKAAAFPP